MKFFQETTDYRDKTPNGVYLLSDDKSKMYAYVAPGSNTVKTFKRFIRIDTRGRKFTPVKNTWGYKIADEENLNPRWTVTGSKGDKYIVERTENGMTCTCSGFKFRGDCKHVKMDHA
jgi:hypothetical protein